MSTCTCIIIWYDGVFFHGTWYNVAFYQSEVTTEVWVLSAKNNLEQNSLLHCTCALQMGLFHVMYIRNPFWTWVIFMIVIFI